MINKVRAYTNSLYGGDPLRVRVSYYFIARLFVFVLETFSLQGLYYSTIYYNLCNLLYISIKFDIFHEGSCHRRYGAYYVFLECPDYLPWQA